MNGLSRWVFFIVAVATAVIVVWQGPRTYSAFLLLQDIAAQGGPSRLKRERATPMREAIAWHVDGRSGWGDLYLPGEGAPKGRLLLVPGLAPEGKDHPFMAGFAESFARAGFAVLVPEIETLRELRASPEDAKTIAAAARHLAAHEIEGAVAEPVALAAVSYAAGPALLAALEPAAAEAIGLILAIGPYASTEAIITYVTTGKFRQHADEAWRTGTPNPYGRWAFLAANAARVADESDRRILREIAARRWASPAADITDLTSSLKAEGRAVMALLDNTDPEQVSALIAELPKDLSADIAALDLTERDFSGLQARVLLIHGKDDAIIPYTESLRLAERLPAAQRRLALLEHLMHVEFQKAVAPGDALALLGAGRAIIAFRDE